MKNSTVHLISCLKKKLSEFPKIVDKLTLKDPSFVVSLSLWIKESEEIFASYNISEVSELAGYRSKILSANINENSLNKNKKKEVLKVASESLFELQRTILNVLKPKEDKIEECRELIRQLLQIISQTETIKYNDKEPFDNLVSEIWTFILSNGQLKSGAVKLKTVLSVQDIYMLITEEINLEDF